MSFTFTVFAVYEDNMQPYCTAVDVPTNDPTLAFAAARAQANEDNEGHIELVGMQVVRGNVTVLA